MFSQSRYLWLTYRTRVTVAILVCIAVVVGSAYLILTRKNATAEIISGVVQSAGHYPDAGVFTTASQMVVVSVDGGQVQLHVPRGCKLLAKGEAVRVRVTQYSSGSREHELAC